jgi:hypothetical protein
LGMEQDVWGAEGIAVGADADLILQQTWTV